MRVCAIIILFLVTAAVFTAQQPQFEVATVKLSPRIQGDQIAINLSALCNDTLTFGNTTLAECLQYAY